MALPAAMLLGLAAAPGQAFRQETTPAVDQRVREAIVHAVCARLGQAAAVRIEGLQVTIVHDAPGDLIAVPDPQARLGQQVQFSLAASQASGGSGRHAGVAVARVFAEVSHARSARSIARGDRLEAGDVVSQRTEVSGLPLRRLPDAAEAIGASALRDLAAGTVLTHAVLIVPPLVKSGDVVTVKVTSDGIEATGKAVAAQNGFRGQTIRVVTEANRRGLQARVVARGEVEVVR